MKGKKFALLMILPMLVSFARAGSYVIEDDIYYNPDAKNPIVEQKEKEKAAEQQAKQAQQAQQAALQEAQPMTQQEPVQKTLVMTTDNRFFDVDEYNRRGSSSQEMTLEQVAANQTEPSVEYNIVDENGDDGYYLNGFNGTQSDYEYALRIRRFHNPKFAISISDPFYSDIYFLDNNDWNVYISDNYAWVTPTWTNPWYWDYMWSPYSYTSWSWRWNLGPWGFSFGYDPLYRWGGYWGGYWNGYWSGYWGWNRPYFHHHFYSPYYYHRPHYAWDRPARPQYTPNGRQPNRYGGSVVSSGSSSSVNGRRATVGTASASSVSGRRGVSSVTSSSNGSSAINGVRTNRGTVIGNSTNSNSNRGYSIGSAGTSRRGTTSSGSVSVPSSSQSRRQTTINRTTPSRNSYNSNSMSTGRRSNSSSYNRGTTSSGSSSSFSSGASSSRRSSGSYSSPSSSSSQRSSGTTSRSTSSGGRGGRR